MHSNATTRQQPSGSGYGSGTTSDEIMAILKQLHEQQGATIVMVTHDQQKAEQTQRIVRLFDGRQVH